MAERAVVRSKKDRDGDILALCNPNEYWSPRSKANAIQDIESGTHQYYVPWTDGTRTPIQIVNGPNGKYLRTDKDNTSRNNLDDLPDC
ncbi:MAG: DUF3892 domain-containing protein [Candidatus Thiodiazotropha sp. (ex Lucina pensylvanica)]|nr:DUF3892 domain-containing protein [Candidatus Thiodiazotropha sp. (ex Lucina pensylvanica)]